MNKIAYPLGDGSYLGPGPDGAPIFRNPAPDATPIRGAQASHTMNISAGDAESEAIADAVSEALSPTANTDRGIFERSIAVRRAEKAKQQAIATAAMAKVRSLTASIRSMEDALDGLLMSEVS